MNNKELETLPEYSMADVQPWQKHFSTGLKRGELSVMYASSGVGKSIMSAWANHVHDMTPVDDPVTAWYKQGVTDTGLKPHKKTVDQ